MLLTAPQVLDPIMGTQVSFADWVQLTNFVTQSAGIGLALQQGLTNALPALQPVQVNFPGGSVVQIGGSSLANPQWALCQGLLCASVGSPVGTVVQFNIPINSGSTTRTDAIVCQPAQVEVSTVDRPVEQPGGSKPTQAVPIVINGLAFQYVEGPSGGGNPTIPTGWENFCYISVAVGATPSFSDADLTIDFQYMNPDGFTLTTESLTVPAEGSVGTINVNDTSVWDVDDFGYVVGPHADNAFIFQIISIDENENTLTVLNLNTTINGTGTIALGAFVLPAADAPVVCSTAPVLVPALGSPTGGSPPIVEIYMSSTGSFTEGSYGLIVGPAAACSFYFWVVQNYGKYCRVIALAPGIGGGAVVGSTVATGATIYPCNPPAIVEEDQDNGGILSPTAPVRVKKGTVQMPTGGGSVAVNFAANYAYSGNNTYAISLAGNAVGINPSYSSKTATGFTITGGAPGYVDWVAIGY